MEVLQTGAPTCSDLPASHSWRHRSYEIIGPYQYLSNTSKAVNAGAYIEIANEGFLLMARNGGGTNAALYNLGTGVWSDYNVSGQGTVKDITWLPELVTYSGIHRCWH